MGTNMYVHMHEGAHRCSGGRGANVTGSGLKMLRVKRTILGGGGGGIRSTSIRSARNRSTLIGADPPRI